MKIVRENINFERGADPRKTLGLTSDIMDLVNNKKFENERFHPNVYKDIKDREGSNIFGPRNIKKYAAQDYQILVDNNIPYEHGAYFFVRDETVLKDMLPELDEHNQVEGRDYWISENPQQESYSIIFDTKGIKFER